MSSEFLNEEIETIPDGWELLTIADIADFEGGSQPPKKVFENEYREGLIRLIQIRDYKTNKYLTYIPEELARKKCDETDIMIGRYGPPIFQILRGISGAYNVALIKAIPKNIDKEYLYYILKQEKLFRYIDLLSQRSSGQTGIDMDKLKAYSVLIPTPEEQRGIIKILNIVSEQVKKIENKLDDLTQLKKALVKKLLTEGIEHTKVKESEIGKIPSNWMIDILDNVSVITRLAGYEYTEYWNPVDNGEIIALRGFNIGENKIENETVVERISEELSFQLKRSKLYKGDIVFPCVGTIGKAYSVKEDNKYHINQNIAKITPSEKLYPDFVAYFLMSDITKNQILKFNTSSSQPNVLVGNLRKFLICIPPYEEQIKIVNMVDNIYRLIDKYQEQKSDYTQLKDGLMQQLLTGKIRVTFN